jgi:asparagine synthetase B (glutamine-hydrolysing)
MGPTRCLSEGRMSSCALRHSGETRRVRVPFRSLLGRIRRAIGPAHVVPPETEDRLLFRFGFLFYAAAAPPAGSEFWSRLGRLWVTTTLGPFVLVTHPETRVARHEDGDRITVLVGDAFFTAEPLDRTPLEVLAAADGDRFLDVLDQLSGRFAVITRRGGRTRFYHDAFGARSVFYRQSRALGLASHPELFAHTFGDSPWPDMMRLVGSDWFPRRIPAFLPTDATLYEGILALLPNHGYDVEAQRLFRYWPRHKRRRPTATFDEFFAAIDAYFRGMAGFLARRQPIVSITGGIDSRTLNAALRHHDVSLRTVTWGRFNFEAWELRPVEEIVAYLGGDHNWVDETNDRINDEALLGARNSGNYRSPSPAVAGMARLFGTIPGALWLGGHGSDTIYGAPPPHLCLEDLRPGTLLNSYLRQPVPPSTFAHREFVLREIAEMLGRIDFATPMDMGYGAEEVFAWEHFTGTWAVCSINAMHSAVDATFGFNSRILADIGIAMPAEFRRSKKLFHEVIRRYDERLAAIYFQ